MWSVKYSFEYARNFKGQIVSCTWRCGSIHIIVDRFLTKDEVRCDFSLNQEWEVHTCLNGETESLHIKKRCRTNEINKMVEATFKACVAYGRIFNPTESFEDVQTPDFPS